MCHHLSFLPPLGFWLIAKSFPSIPRLPSLGSAYPRLFQDCPHGCDACCQLPQNCPSPPIYQASNINPLPCQHFSPIRYQYEADALPLHSPLPSNLTYLCRSTLPDFSYCCCRCCCPYCLSPVVIDFVWRRHDSRTICLPRFIPTS